MSNPSLWFITRNGKEHGPLTVDAVKELVQKGQIQADTLVRRGDVAQAIPASQVRGLLPPVVPAPLAAPSTPLQPQPRPAVMPRKPTPRRSDRHGKASGKSQLPAPHHDFAKSEPGDVLDHHAELATTIPEDRASVRERLISMACDMGSIGLIAAILLLAGVLQVWSAGDNARQTIAAKRAQDSAASVARKGDPRPSLEAWPTTQETWKQLSVTLKADIAAIDAQLATMAAEAKAELQSRPAVEIPRAIEERLEKEAKIADKLARINVNRLNLVNELDFRESLLLYENEQYAKDSRLVTEDRNASLLIGSLLIFVGLLIALSVMPLMEGYTGASLGKRLRGLRVVGQDRQPITYKQALIRHAARLIPGLPLLLVTAPDHLGPHDRWSQTEVIYTKRDNHNQAAGRNRRRGQPVVSH